MNKIILFAHIKGGVGKSCMAAMFSEFLHEKEYNVLAMDADIQATLVRHRQREVEADPGAPVPWGVEILPTNDRDKLSDTLEKMKSFNGMVVVDLPGTMNAANLDQIYSAADLLVVPISYEYDVVDATGIFVQVVRNITKAPMVFLPNRISTIENAAGDVMQRDETKRLLGGFGEVTARVKQSVVIKRYSTLYPLDKYQFSAVEHAFDDIIRVLNNWKDGR